MFINWLATFSNLLAFFCIEVFLYALFLLIKALRKYLNSNESNHGTEPRKKSRIGFIGIALLNVVIVIFIIMMPFLQRDYFLSDTENVIICNSENDVEKFSRILDENNIEFKTLKNKRVKIKDDNDFAEAVRLIQENRIDYGVVTVVDE